MTADTDGHGGRTPPLPRESGRPVRWLRCAGRSGFLLTLLTAAALVGGFAWFVGHIPEREVELSRNADGIVALAGGASRIADAIELLAAGRGRRLLISGANPATNAQQISRLNPEFEKWVRCCVDFDRSTNTLGNAIEIKRWASRRGFHSLIIVTSNYHMPRALAEIAHQMPEATLLPFPVIPERQRAAPWWANGTTARLLLSEYVKLLVARVRMEITPSAGAAEST